MGIYYVRNNKRRKQNYVVYSDQFHYDQHLKYGTMPKTAKVEKRIMYTILCSYQVVIYFD